MNSVQQHISPIMSDTDLAALGLQEVAYVKPVKVEGNSVFAIYAADGTEIAILDDRDVAMAAIRQHDLAPVSVH
ncbi:MAG TPA: DUF1150 family protein [Alphaproteobacteria bacterium]|nr:DUF1150 family protein [Alphaproteobacteria bacterium]